MFDWADTFIPAQFQRKTNKLEAKAFFLFFAESILYRWFGRAFCSFESVHISHSVHFHLFEISIQVISVYFKSTFLR